MAAPHRKHLWREKRAHLYVLEVQPSADGAPCEEIGQGADRNLKKLSKKLELVGRTWKRPAVGRTAAPWTASLRTEALQAYSVGLFRTCCAGLGLMGALRRELWHGCHPTHAISPGRCPRFTSGSFSYECAVSDTCWRFMQAMVASRRKPSRAETCHECLSYQAWHARACPKTRPVTTAFVPSTASSATGVGVLLYAVLWDSETGSNEKGPVSNWPFFLRQNGLFLCLGSLTA